MLDISSRGVGVSGVDYLPQQVKARGDTGEVLPFAGLVVGWHIASRLFRKHCCRYGSENDLRYRMSVD